MVSFRPIPKIIVRCAFKYGRMLLKKPLDPPDTDFIEKSLGLIIPNVILLCVIVTIFDLWYAVEKAHKQPEVLGKLESRKDGIAAETHYCR